MVKFNLIIEKDEDGVLTSEVVELQGCHTQAKTMEELLERTKEAVSLYLKCNNNLPTECKFLGFQQIEV